MKILHSSELSNNSFQGSVVTIGNFDGVHRGHVEIFRHLRQCGDQRKLPTVVVTFEPHPLKLLAPDKAPMMITGFDQKVALIAESGIDYLVVVSFTTEFASLSADDFVNHFLCDALKMRHMVIGHDYAFGKGREGNYQTLERIGAERGYTLEDMEPVGDNGVIYSSSLARRQITDGFVRAVSSILGRHYCICGLVVHGRHIGRTLGFPTANLEVQHELIPRDGVYAVMVNIAGILYQGACNIGTNPTFDGNQRSIEVLVLDFSGDLYGSVISVCFVDRVRNIQKFSTVELLKQAIQTDTDKVREILNNLDKS